MKRIALLLLLLLTCTVAAAAGRKAVPKSAPVEPPAAAPAHLFPAPPLFTADYTVHADGFKIGEMSRSMKALGNDTYLLETRLHTTGLAALIKPDEYVERSTLRVTTTGYEPLQYSNHYTGRFHDTVETLRFDWSHLRGYSLRDEKETEFGLQPGVLDKLMYQVAMQYDMSHGVKEFRYNVADRGKIAHYTMDVVGEETLDTPLGRHDTIKVKKGTTMIWCAPDLDYVPVKLEQNEGGHTITSVITRFKREPATVTDTPAQ